MATVDEVLNDIEEKVAMGKPPPLDEFKEAFSVCAAGGDVPTARRLVVLMHTSGAAPEPAAFTAALSSCSSGSGGADVALSLLRTMVASSGIRPDREHYAEAIKACGASGRPRWALGLLDRMRRAGYQPGVAVYNACIEGIARGALRKGEDDDAPSVGANQRPGAAADGPAAQAGRLVAQMHSRGLVHNADTYNWAVRAAAAGGDAEICVGLLRQAFRAAAGVGDDGAASAATASDRRPTPATCQVALAAAAAAADASDAADILHLMGVQGMEPDAGALSDAAVAAARGAIAGSGDDISNVSELLARVRERGEQPSLRALAAAIAVCPDVPHALVLLEEAKAAAAAAVDGDGDEDGEEWDWDETPWTWVEAGVRTTARMARLEAVAAAGAVGDGGRGKKAGKGVVKELTLPPATLTACYAAAVRVCATAADAETAVSLLHELRPSVAASTTAAALRTAAKTGDRKGNDGGDGFADADAAGDTYDACVDACTAAGDARRALALVAEAAAAGLPPSAARYESCVAAFCAAGEPGRASALLTEMRGHGLPPSTAANEACVAGFVRAGALGRALDMLRDMARGGLTPPAAAYGLCVVAAAQGGSRQAAALAGIADDNTAAPAAAASAAAASREILREMQARGLSPDVAAYGACALAAVRAGDAGSARALLEEMRVAALEPARGTWLAVIEGLAATSAAQAAAEARAMAAVAAATATARTAGRTDAAAAMTVAAMAAAREAFVAAAAAVESLGSDSGRAAAEQIVEAAATEGAMSLWVRPGTRLECRGLPPPAARAAVRVALRQLLRDAPLCDAAKRFGLVVMTGEDDEGSGGSSSGGGGGSKALQGELRRYLSEGFQPPLLAKGVFGKPDRMKVGGGQISEWVSSAV